MAENTAISWCDSTFNHVRGCTKVSAGCASCYADTMSKRNPKTLGVWGPNGTRVVASEAMWKKPLKWNREAAPAYIPVCAQCGADAKHDLPRCPECEYGIDRSRPRVFCASLADVFEDWQGPIHNHKGEQLYQRWHHAQPEWVASSVPCEGEPVTMDDVRSRLFRLIDATPNLDWLVLTKRPENIRRMWPGWQGDLASAFTSKATPKRRENVFLGTSVENQEYAEKRIPELLRCRDLSPVLFLSCEPLLGPLDMIAAHWGTVAWGDRTAGINWVIVGGESGPKARPMDINWARSLRDQCAAAKVPFHFKQFSQADTKGFNDFATFPDELKIREFPHVGTPILPISK